MCCLINFSKIKEKTCISKTVSPPPYGAAPCRRATALICTAVLIAASAYVPFLHSLFAPSATPPISQAADVGASTLNEKRNEAYNNAVNNFKFASTSLPKWNGAEVACYNATNRTFTVDTPEKLAYALHHAGDDTSVERKTINIAANIDMNGAQYTFTNRCDWNYVTFQGNGHTIYNFKSVGETKVGLCSQANYLVAANVVFSNCYLKGTNGDWVGMFPFVKFKTTIKNVHVRNSLMINTTDLGDPDTGMGQVGCIYGKLSGSKTDISENDNCSSINNTTIGGAHIGGTFGSYDWVRFINCYSSNDTIISYAGHSGVLSACANQGNYFENCWTNSTIYGNDHVGGFAGPESAGGTYKNCWSSGIVEGQSTLGGFLAQIKLKSTIVKNCYSTAQVGLNYGGRNIGGFAGIILAEEDNSTYKSHISNCYAAGEVGSVDVTEATAKSSYVGGFAGQIVGTPDNVFSNCFYDMQTTAMRNIPVGGYDPVPMHRTTSHAVETDLAQGGIKGITTSLIAGKSNIFGANSAWIYENGLLPQLSYFANYNYSIYRANSTASTMTVFCDEWRQNTNTGFDTVRDMMSSVSFSSLSSSVPTDTNLSTTDKESLVSCDGVQSINWAADTTTSPLAQGAAVISLSSSAPYKTVFRAPGISWATASVVQQNAAKTDTSSAVRKIRLIPTNMLDAGKDALIRTGSQDDTNLYNHGSDVSATYLEGSPLSKYLADNIAHPEAILSFPENSIIESNRITGTLSLPMNLSTKSCTISVEVSPQQDASLLEDFLEKLAGKTRFIGNDEGKYTLVYTMTLPDGRYATDEKKFEVLATYAVLYKANCAIADEDPPISFDTTVRADADKTSLDGYVLWDGQKDTGDMFLVRHGYRFTGWSLDAEGALPICQKDIDEMASSSALKEDLLLYAQWTPLDYTVKWIDAKTGEAIDEQSVSYGNDGAVPAIPSHRGHHFTYFSGDDWHCVDSNREIIINYSPYLYMMPQYSSANYNGFTFDYEE